MDSSGREREANCRWDESMRGTLREILEQAPSWPRLQALSVMTDIETQTEMRAYLPRAHAEC